MKDEHEGTTPPAYLDTKEIKVTGHEKKKGETHTHTHTQKTCKILLRSSFVGVKRTRKLEEKKLLLNDRVLKPGCLGVFHRESVLPENSSRKSLPGGM